MRYTVYLYDKRAPLKNAHTRELVLMTRRTIGREGLIGVVDRIGIGNDIAVIAMTLGAAGDAGKAAARIFNQVHQRTENYHQG